MLSSWKILQVSAPPAAERNSCSICTHFDARLRPTSVVFGDEHAHCSAFAPIDIEGRAGADEFALQSIQIFGRYVELGRLRAGFDVGAEL